MKHIFLIIFLLIAAVASAQVVEFHESYGTETDNVAKYYMNSIDSIVYVPEQHWGGSITVDNVRLKDDNTLIATITIEVEANADFAAYALGENISQTDFEEGNVNYQRVYPGTSTFDVEAPLDGSMNAYLYTKNKYNKELPCLYSNNLSTYKSLGYGTITENFWSGDTWNVQIQQSFFDPQTFRLVRPFPYSYYEQATDMLEFRVYKAGETLLDQTLTQDVVYWDYNNAALSYYSNYDDIIYMVFPGSFSKYATQDYWTHNTVLSYQENGLPAQVQFAPYYYMFNVGGWNYTQEDNMFVITFPGVVIYDYSAEVSYSGVFVDSDNKVYAVGNVTLGSDVASAKVTVVPGKDAIDDAYNGIKDGLLENVVEITGSGAVNVPMPADAQTGNYTMAVVTYDASGAIQKSSYVTFKYVNADDYGNWDLTKPLVGTYTYAQFFEGDDEGLTMTPNGDGTFTISHWGYDVDFTFTLNDDNTLTFDDQYIGYTHSTYGDVYIRDLGLYEGQEVGTYSPEEGVFTFQTYYFVDAGYFGYGPETFTITGYANSAAKEKAAKIISKPKPAKTVCNPMPIKPNRKSHSVKAVRRTQTKNVEEIAKRNHLKMAPAE